MRGGVPRHALQFQGHINQFVHRGVLLILAGKLFRGLQRFLQRHFQLHGHQLCHGVHLLIGHVQHAAHVANYSARCHGAKCDNLCHMVCPVFMNDVINHFTAPLVTEIHIKIRHRDAFGVQKALEQQLVTNGVNICDANAVCSKASRARAAARPHRNAPLPRIVDEIVYNEVIVDIPHAVNNAYFIIQPLAHLVRHFLAIAAVQALFAQANKIAAVVLPVRRLEIGKFCHAKFKIEIALPGNSVGVFACLRPCREQRIHLVRAFYIELIGAKFQHIVVVYRFVRLDADEDMLHARIFFAQVVGVVCGNQGDACLL